jgi:hypothetical protein
MENESGFDLPNHFAPSQMCSICHLRGNAPADRNACFLHGSGVRRSTCINSEDGDKFDARKNVK